jgi:hypothetical protein
MRVVMRVQGLRDIPRFMDGLLDGWHEKWHE